MLNYQKIQPVENSIENIDFQKITKVKTKDIIKFNLGVAYFIILTFLLVKLLFT